MGGTVMRWLGVAVLAAAAPAAAATVNVSPTRVVLGPNAASGSITLTNVSNVPVRFQVHAFQWTNVGTTQMSLEPTDDLVFFPSLMMLQPGEARLVRVASHVAAVARERTYRLVLKQLDSFAANGAEPGVRMALELSVPVFVQPRESRVAADVPEPEIASRTVVLRLANIGPIHLTPQRIELRGLDASGALVWTRTFDPWYLLAGELRRYAAPLAADECQRTAVVVTDVLFQELKDRPLRPRAPVAAGACGAP